MFRNPADLSRICLDKLMCLILDKLNCETISTSIVTTQIKAYLEIIGATPSIYQNILFNCSYYNLDAQVGLRCLDMFLHATATILHVRYFIDIFTVPLGQLLAERGSCLYDLDMRDVHVETEDMPILCEALRKCPNLRKFKLHYMADDSLLQALAETCNKLRLLDISDHPFITSIGIEYLTKGVCHNTLIYFNVGRMFLRCICVEDIVSILQCCPNLQLLNFVHFVGRALKLLYENNPDFKCKLYSVHDTANNLNVDVVLKTCPYVEKIVVCRHEEPHTEVMEFKQDCKLRTVVIAYVSYCSR